MSTLQTSLTVSSSQLFPGTITLANTAASTINGDANYGRVTVSRGSNTLLNNSQIGGRGSYLYLSSPTSNSKAGAINIFGESALVDGEPIATLYPGEFAIVPVSKRQGRLYATATHTNQVLDYLIGNRGDYLGQSALITFDKDDALQYSLSDSAAAEVNRIVSNGFSPLTYNRYVWTIVQNKGYLLKVYGSGMYQAVPINTLGQLVQHELPVTIMDDTLEDLDGKGVFFNWYDGAEKVALFDGDEVMIHEFPNANNAYLDNNYDQAAADGTMTVYVEDYEGVSGLDAVFAVNGHGANLISSVNYNDDSDYVDTYVYNYANVILLITRNDNSGLVKNFKIFNTSGVKLKEVTLPDGYTTIDRDFYGVGRCAIRVYSDNDIDLPWLFFNYDQATNTLTGEDLSWTHDRGSDYEYCELLSKRLHHNNSEVNAKADTLAMIVYSIDSASNHIANQNMRYADLVYMFDGETTPKTFNIWSFDGDFLPVSTRNNNSGNECIVTSNVIYIPWAESTTAGPLNLLYVKKGQTPVSFAVIANQNTVNNPENNNTWRFQNFGDNAMLAYNTAAGDTVYKAIGGNSVLDTLTIVESTYEFNFRIRGKSLFIRAWGLPISETQTPNWYFDITAGTFVKLTTFYSQRYYVEGTTANGRNDGIMLLFKPPYYQPNETFKAAFLKDGVLGTEKTLLSMDPYNWEIRLSAQGVALAYREMIDSNWKVKFFDLSLNQLYEIDTEVRNLQDYEAAGNRNHWVFYDNNSNYKFYSFSAAGAALQDIGSADYSNIALNDYWWWD